MLVFSMQVEVTEMVHKRYLEILSCHDLRSTMQIEGKNNLIDFGNSMD